MRYNAVQPAIFQRRINRFIASVLLDGAPEQVHVKNTGRCGELFVPGCPVYLEKSQNPARKTRYDLIAVQKNGLLFNVDSQAPNLAAGEWLRAGGLGPLDEVRAEYTLGDSRFDFFARRGEERHLIEVKGCTLEQDGIARFPDAPTLRGVKHLQELAALQGQGWQCALLMVIQFQPVRHFEPNWATHPAFGHAMLQARQAGVQLLAMDCRVTPQSMALDKPVPLRLEPPSP